jgi:Tfp pilus assembly protein PilN
VIRTNLATRPFYNEGAVRFWLALLAIVVAAATVFNLMRLVQYSRSDTELATQASRDESGASELKAEAVRVRGTVDAKQIEAASVDARLANDLIDRRTFSWTELFNIFETTLPSDVRITSIRPRIELDRQILLTITLLARSVEDVDMFMQNLEMNGAFEKVLSSDERVNEEGLIDATLETVYIPGKIKKP